jgi:hypothetical protein
MNGEPTEGGQGETGTDTGFWEPPRFETEICCMPGMACWTGAFANAAGRANIEAQIKSIEEEMGKAKEIYDELNAEQEREAAEERAFILADARDAEAKLSNEILNS